MRLRDASRTAFKRLFSILNRYIAARSGNIEGLISRLAGGKIDIAAGGFRIKDHGYIVRYFPADIAAERVNTHV